MDTNTNETHNNVVEEVQKELRDNQFSDFQLVSSRKKGYDFSAKKDGIEIYFGVIKMKHSKKGKKNSPFGAISLAKWNFAVNHSDTYCFAIVYEDFNNSHIISYYSVEECWGMTSQPTYQLYCHYNRVNRHPNIGVLNDLKHLLCKNKNKIAQCIQSYQTFKNKFQATLKQ